MRIKWQCMAWVLLAAAGLAGAQTPVAPAKGLSDHVRKDIERHRAMAAAHEAAARCLESGKKEDACLKELQAACKGLAIGKYCGMRHEH
ncbi:MAG TPA: hypothetical protein VNO84_09860 [Burkholderiaceae bacterium]|nr:hypothetical protein [Burkholderiaceae bacterium]